MNLWCSIGLAIILFHRQATVVTADCYLWFPGREIIYNPQFSEDGKYLAVGTVHRLDDMTYRTVIVLDTQTWRPVREIVLDSHRKIGALQRAGLREKRYVERARRCGFAWLPRSGGRLLYFTPEGRLYSILVTDSQSAPEILWKGRAIFRVSVSPGGKDAALVARSPNSEGVVCILLDISTRRVILEHPTSMPGAPYPVAAFSQDGTYLAVSDGELIDVLDLKTGKLIAEALADGDDYIISLLFSPDDHVLLALDFTGEIRWWDWQRGKVLGSILIQGIDSLASIEEFRCAGASYIVVWNSSGVAVYDIKRLKVLWSKPWHCTGCSSQPGRSLLAVTTSKDGMVYDRIAFIDSRTGELRRPKD